MNVRKRQQHLHIKVTKKLKIFFQATKSLIKHASKISKWSLNWSSNHLINLTKLVHTEKYQNNLQKFTLIKIPAREKK